MLNLQESFITRNRTFTNPQIITPRGIMIHSVGTPQPRASVFINNINNQTASTSYHAIIEEGGRAFQLLPWNYRAWHAGGQANNTHIGVELTEPSTIRYTSGANFVDNNPAETRRFVQDTYQTAVELFADLCRQFGLNPLADGVIISHSEGHRRGIASNHGDVEHLWTPNGLSMAQFRQDIAARLGQETMGEVSVSGLFRVVTETSPLNVRSGPSPTAPILGTLARGSLVSARRRAGDWLYVEGPNISGWASRSFLRDAVELAVNALVRQKIITNPKHWLTSYRNLAFLDRLLVNLGDLHFRGGSPVSSLDTALGILSSAGAMNNPQYWRENHQRIAHLDTLLKRAAGAL